MESTINTNIDICIDEYPGKSKTNVVKRTGTAVVFSSLMALSFANETPEYFTSIFETNTFEYVANKHAVQKLSFRERYKQISKSDWFINSYKDMSIGEIINVD